MADVQPFRGLLFNPQVVADLSNAVCPPYDVISPDFQKELYNRSPFNAVRLEEGEVHPSDTSSNNRYMRAADTLRQWTIEGALIRDKVPAYYLIRHSFHYQGKPLTRLGLMAAVRLEEYNHGVVLPHEYTQRAAKQDRLALMDACHTNFSHIMLLYRDSDSQMLSLFRQIMANDSAFSFSDAEGDSYAMWRITDALNVKLIREAMSTSVLYIADGHHRYETSLAYRDNQVKEVGTEDSACNFVMSYLVEFDDPGLVVLPYHRLVRGLDTETLTRLYQNIDHLFASEPLGEVSQVTPDKLLAKMEMQAENAQVLGIVRGDNNTASLLTLPPKAYTEEQESLTSFEAWVLEEKILKPTLGDSLDQHVSWTHDAHEAIENLKNGQYQVAFFLRPLNMNLFQQIVGRGERLPRKSTFFYPKLPTGLTINLLDGRI